MNRRTGRRTATALALPSRRTTVAVTGVLIVGLLAVLALSQPAGPQEPRAIVGRSVPDTSAVTLDGADFRLTDLRGSAAIVNVWNSWCGPCRREAPVLERFHDRHAGEGDFAMVGLVHDDTPRAVRHWVTRREVPWAIVLDPDKRLAIDLGVISQPETYAIDATGRIVAKHYGEVSIDQLEELLARARNTTSNHGGSA